MSTAPAQDLTPALVVVDSRNLFHQCDAATGFRLRPQVQGVVEAMRWYGFDALEVHVGIALPRSHDIKELSDVAKVNSDYMNQVDAHERGAVLLGELHRKERRGGRFTVEEKQVDVACAVDICRHATLIARHESKFKAIIVLSQDTDLKHALEYAREVYVPLVVAAHEKVERRGFDYMLLTERAFRSIGQIHEPLAGHQLRTAVAKAASGPDKWIDWTVGEWDPARERVLVVDPQSGLRGVVKNEHLNGATAGDTVRLRVAGVDFGRRRRDFPLLVCSPKNPHSAHDHRSVYERRIVRGRRAHDEIVLDRKVAGRDRMPYPVGGLAGGSQVLIDVTEPRRPIVVGALDEHASRDLVQAKPLCVIPFKTHTSTSTFARTEAGGRVLITHSAAAAPELEQRYAAVLIESAPKAIAKLISSPLP